MDPLADLFLRYREHGDLAALGQVFDQLAPRLLRVALHLCSNPADAEDVLQQTFLLAMERADTFDATRRLEPWLAGLLSNVARNAAHRAARRRAEELGEVASTGEGPLAAAERAELVAQIRTKVHALPGKQRQVLLLQLRHGLSPAEIAEVLEVPPGTVRMRLHRGLAALRRLLPAGHCALISGLVPARGLAAVRRAVLRAAKQRATVSAATGAAAVLAGGMMMKKLALAIGAVVLACIAVLSWRETPEAVRPPEREAVPAAAVDAGAKKETPAGTSGVPEAERTAARAARGALRVRVMARISSSAPGLERSTAMPVSGVLVQVWPGTSDWVPLDGSAPMVRTDAGGEVVLTDLAAAEYRVQLVAGGEATPMPAIVEAGREAVVELLSPAHKLVLGIVVDADGQPVPGADVWVQRSIGMGRFSLIEPTGLIARCAGTTGADGAFRLAVTGQEYCIAASKPGHGASLGRFTHEAGLLRLVLGREHATVSGTVVDGDRRPVASAYVLVAPPGQDSRRAADGTLLGPRVPQVVRTGQDGRFRFDGLPPGRQRLTALTEPGMPSRTEVDVAAFAMAEVEIELKGGVTVIGTVRRCDGSPAGGLHMAARPRLDPNGHYSHCATRPDGTFLLPYVPVRRFFVTIGVGREQIVAHRELADPKPGVLRCDFQLDELAALRGRVVGEGGEGLQRWGVQAVDTKGRAAWSPTGADGTFELNVLTRDGLAGAFRVAAFPVGGDVQNPAVTRDGVKPGSGPIELRVPASAMPCAFVRGRLVDAEGRPAAGREVRLELVVGVRLGTTRSSEDGRFELGPCAAGTFRLLLVAAAGRERLLHELVLRHGELLELGSLGLPALATLRIEVVHADGSPWAAAMPYFEVVDAQGTRAGSEQVARAAGREIELEPGRYRFRPVGPDILGEPQEVALEVGKTHTLRCRVSIGRSRELVFNGDGKLRPDRGAPLHVVVRTAEGAIAIDRTVTDPRWTVRGFYYWVLDHCFAPGSYRVEASTASGLRYATAFDVRPSLDDPTRVDVPLAAR